MGAGEGDAEDDVVGCHHRLNGHEFESTPGVGDEQGGLECSVHGVAKSWRRRVTELTLIVVVTCLYAFIKIYRYFSLKSANLIICK